MGTNGAEEKAVKEVIVEAMREVRGCRFGKYGLGRHPPISD
jgi:hypothetical protein